MSHGRREFLRTTAAVGALLHTTPAAAAPSSPHTISAYRDTFGHFLKFARQRLQKPPSRLTFEEIDAPLIVAFLDDLERHGLSIRTRNLRLTAFHSFFRYAAFELPTHAAQIQRVLAIPSKRFTRTLVQFLTRRSRRVTGCTRSADLVWRCRPADDSAPAWARRSVTHDGLSPPLATAPARGAHSP
jgi:hypothetical protein